MIIRVNIIIYLMLYFFGQECQIMLLNGSTHVAYHCSKANYKKCKSIVLMILWYPFLLDYGRVQKLYS